jgi:hypothetical protein
MKKLHQFSFYRKKHHFSEVVSQLEGGECCDAYFIENLVDTFLCGERDYFFLNLLRTPMMWLHLLMEIQAQGRLAIHSKLDRDVEAVRKVWTGDMLRTTEKTRPIFLKYFASLQETFMNMFTGTNPCSHLNCHIFSHF